MNPSIAVWWPLLRPTSFGQATRLSMTTGKRFALRTKDHSDQRVIDARAKAVLHALSNEPRGRALEAYLRVMGKR